MDDLISRQAAIDAIRKIYDSVGILGEKWAVDKCQMAIKDLPSAQPETSILTVTVNPDSEEIERVARKIKDAPVMVLPSAQPEIVRCRDCVYFPEGTGANHDLEFPEEFKCPCECEDYWYSWKPDDDWYCKNGKRKENRG